MRASIELSIALPSPVPRSTRSELKVSYKFSLDRTGKHIAVDISEFHVRFIHEKRTWPIVRYEFESTAQNKPGAHPQIHSDSVPLALSLASNQKRVSAFNQAQIHNPIGGHRYCVYLEDIIEFYIAEFGFVGRDGGEEYIQSERESFEENTQNLSFD